VAVFGSGNPALTAVNELSSYAHTVYSIARGTVKADPVLVERTKKTGKVEFLSGYAVEEIRGTDRVEGLVLRRLEDGKVVVLPLGGVFVEIGATPNSDFARELVRLNERKEIEVDCECKTNVPGIFAAGDVTNAPEKQIIVAAGEGAKAALSAYRYLVRLHKE
jgi:alkyl hydroperoxide reductase subunit F